MALGKFRSFTLHLVSSLLLVYLFLVAGSPKAFAFSDTRIHNSVSPYDATQCKSNPVAANCNLQGPWATGCSADQNLVTTVTVGFTYNTIGTLYLYHSKTCKTEWGQYFGPPAYNLSGMEVDFVSIELLRCSTPETNSSTCAGHIDDQQFNSQLDANWQIHTNMAWEPYMSTEVIVTLLLHCCNGAQPTFSTNFW